MPPRKKNTPVEIVMESSDDYSSSDETSDTSEMSEMREMSDSINHSILKPVRTKELEINCMELHDQILHRPDTYVGNVLKTRMQSLCWIARDGRIVKNTETIQKTDKRGNLKVVTEEIGPCVSEGFIRTIIEIICNMIDNVWRSKEFGISAKTIKIDIDEKTGRITTWNDGKPLSHAFHKKMKKRNIELICSRLLTSTNYNDEEKKKTSGRNGYGMKLTNIFSQEFEVESYNPNGRDDDEKPVGRKQIYRQKWTDNMYKCGEPQIALVKETIKEGASGYNGYTSFSWIPDFKRFGMSGFDRDSIGVIEKYIFDTAMIVSKYNVSTFMNGRELGIKSIRDYALLYLPSLKSTLKKSNDEVSDDEGSDDEVSGNEGSDDERSNKESDEQEIHLFCSSDSKVVIIPFKEHICVSFANGILTTEGGVHEDAWIEAIFRPIVNKINRVKTVKEDDKKRTKAEKERDKKKKEKTKNTVYQVDIKTVKNHFAVFIDTEVDNPIFRGQNKTFLGGKTDGTPIETKIKKGDIPSIMKWSVIEDIKNLLEIKEMSDLRGKKGFVKIEGYDMANNSKKPSKRRKCVLGITEGLSAKTYVVSGMKIGLLNIDGELVRGRDWIGAMPIRGKFINPRGKSVKTISLNKEVLAIIQALGLEPGLDYEDEENFSKLKYGRLCVFADADKDGIHIIGLLYNFFHKMFPSLLRVSGFFTFNRSPIMKVSYKNETVTFYALENARKFIEEKSILKKNVKYFKGLGTSRSSDIKQDFGKKLAEITPTSSSDSLVDNLFNPKKTTYRKDWITSFDSSKTVEINVEDGDLEFLEFDDFANKELILFSIEDCKRSIPNIFDGLKESQRKILYSVFKRKLSYKKESLKVAQLSGYTAEHTLYEHGEDNLLDTTRGMALRYPGSNNLPLLLNDGQFGTRMENGKDGASGRYIFTKEEMYTRLVFPEKDDVYLPNVEHDGDIIEKVNYVPIIPMILINGSSGIGTGFSSSIPQYKVEDILECVRLWIKTGGSVMENIGDGIIVSDGPTLVPYYRNFKGRIEMDGGKAKTFGVIESLGKNRYRVSELPIGRKCWSISKFKERLDDLLEKKVIKDYDLLGDEKNIDFVITEDPDGMKMTLENLGLVDSVHTSNMVLFTDDKTLKRYQTVEEILVDFCVERLKLYKTRRDGDIKTLKEELKFLNNKIRFIDEVNLSDTDKRRLILKDKEDSEIRLEMERRGYDKKCQKKKMKELEKEEENTIEDDGNEGLWTFNYLLSQHISSITKKKMGILLNEKKCLEDTISKLELETAEQIWLRELEEFERKYREWLPNADDDRDDYETGKKRVK